MRLKNHGRESGHSDIALKFIRFLAADDDRLSAMMTLTGLDGKDFATRAADPQFQAFVLDYGLMNESLLIEFAANEGLKPEAIMQARRKLPGAEI